MNDQDWNILKVIAEENNITKAAKRLFITQSTLSYRLKIIEKEFNVNIFLRTPKGVVLTPEGQHIIQYAKNMLNDLKITKEYTARTALGLQILPASSE